MRSERPDDAICRPIRLVRVGLSFSGAKVIMAIGRDGSRAAARQMKFVSRLDHVLAVAELGSFSRAAEELNLSQSALSRSISGFEGFYGVKIFERGRGGAALTAAGATMIAEARALARATRTFENNLVLLSKGERGKVAIGVTPLIASLLLPHAGTHLLNSRPQVQIKSETLPADHLLERLLADEVEIVFGPQTQFPRGGEIAFHRLGAATLTYLVRAGHPLAGRTVTPDDLAAYPVASALEKASAGLPAFSGSFVCDNHNIMREVVLGSDAVWLTSPRIVADEIGAGRLVELAGNNIKPMEADIAALTLKGRTMSPLAQEVIRAAREVFSS